MGNTKSVWAPVNGRVQPGVFIPASFCNPALSQKTITVYTALDQAA